MNKTLAFLLILALGIAGAAGFAGATAGTKSSPRHTTGVAILLADLSPDFQGSIHDSADPPAGQNSGKLAPEAKASPTPIVPVPPAVRSGLLTLALLAGIAVFRKIKASLRA